MEIRIGRQKAELPNKNGAYNTKLGQLKVEIIDQIGNGVIPKVALGGEVMRGTPLKNRHKRTSRKVVSLDECGHGAQTLSKRETVYVDLYPSHKEEILRDVQILFRDDGY